MLICVTDYSDLYGLLSCLCSRHKCGFCQRDPARLCSYNPHACFNLVKFSQLFMLHGFDHCLCHRLLVLTKFSYTVLQYNPSALKHSCQQFLALLFNYRNAAVDHV